MERELIEATVYECNYKDFSKATTKDGTPIYDWSNAVWSLYNTKNGYSNAVLKLDILQRGKDENGFYQNYIYLVVRRRSEYMWEEYLKSLGYVNLENPSVINIYAYGQDSVTMALLASAYALLQAGIPLPSYPVSEDEYRRLMSACINDGDEAPFCNMHYRSLVNRLETVIQVYREALENQE